jgi:D-alanyl-D-alanine carboxypeptidase/D-alanyl-D-alanine-endopeptidase (penicillin-binding protein 4)
MLTHDQLVGARNRLQLDRSAPVELREEFAPLWAGNWEFGDLGNKYAAPVCAFTVDRGGFEIWADKGRPVFKPEAYGTRVCISDSPSAQMRYDPVQRTLTASKGAFAKNGRLDTLSLPHPDEAAASLLGRGFRRTESTPSRPPDLVIAGPRTIDIVSACLPPSDNQLAEQLLLLGARAEGPLGSDPYKTAQARLGNFLVRVVGADPNDLRIDDGSGLSRHNYVTTRLIAKLLAWENGLPTAAGWRAALAHAGSGTLASRLKGLTFVGKTGSLDMVVALSGYVQCADGHERIVSVILNEFGCSAREARDVADAFVSAVASFSF